MTRTTTMLVAILFAAACGGKDGPPAEEAAGAHPALHAPFEATETAPAEFQVKFETSEGDFTVKAVREWAPHGVDRLYNLVRIGYFTDCAIFRVIPGFVAQFGIHGDPEVSAVWTNARIEADPVKVSNKRGFVTFAMIGQLGPGSRTSQLFVNLKDNTGLDRQGFAPVGEVVQGMEVVDRFHGGYGNDIDQRAFRAMGNRYIKRDFPEIDFIRKATIIAP